MKPLPHHYTVSATSADEHVLLESEGLQPIKSAAPEEFDGPGDCWSPETLLAAAVADCFVLSFKAIAKASGFDWTDITCTVEATLDRTDKITRFTSLLIKPRLTIPASSTGQLANRLLQKAETSCLISNSLNAEIKLDPEVLTA